jgi:hypothetical protein
MEPTSLLSDKDPSNIPSITYAWVIMLSLLGGIASFMQKLKEGHTRVFNVIELIGECCVSALVGIITFFLCESADISRMKSAALVAISGHMGSKAMKLLEGVLSKSIPTSKNE